MEENNNIDDIFKSALDDLKMEPSAKNWDTLSSRLSAKRAARLKKKRGLWFSMAALLLIFSYSAYKITKPVLVSAPDKIQNETSNKTSELTSVHQTEVSTQAQSSTTSINASAPDVSENTIAITGPEIVQQKTAESYTPKSENTAGSSANKTNTVTPSVTSSAVLTTANNSSVNKQPVASNQSVTTNRVENNATHSSANANTNPVTQHSQSNVAKPDATDVIVGSAIVAGAAKSSAAHSANQPTANNSQSSASNSSSNNSTNEPADANDKKSATETNETDISNESGNTNGAPAGVVAGATVANDFKANEAKPTSTTDNPASTTTTSTTATSTPTDSTKLSDYLPLENPEESKSVFKRILSNIGAEVYYTPEYAKSKMTVNDDYTGPASKNLADYANESSQYSFSTGVNLQYKIGKKWSVLSGIQSSEFAKTAVYNSISVVADSVFQQEYVDPSGGGSGHGGGGHGGGGHHHGNNHGGSHGGHGHSNPGNPNDPNSNHHYVIHTPCGSFDLENAPPNSANATNGDTLKVKTEIAETVHFMSIPLLVRYSFGVKKLSYFVEAGGAINYVTTDKVKIVVNDATSEESDLNSLSNMNYTLLFGFGANYNFTKGFGMFLKPSLRYSVTPINIDSPVNSYPYYLGVSAGFSIHF